MSATKERERQEMIRGYREMAALNRTLADEVTNESWPRYAWMWREGEWVKRRADKVALSLVLHIGQRRNS